MSLSIHSLHNLLLEYFTLLTNICMGGIVYGHITDLKWSLQYSALYLSWLRHVTEQNLGNCSRNSVYLLVERVRLIWSRWIWWRFQFSFEGEAARSTVLHNVTDTTTANHTSAPSDAMSLPSLCLLITNNRSINDFRLCFLALPTFHDSSVE